MPRAKTMEEIGSAIKSLCDAFDRLPDTDTPLEDMQAKGIDRGKYDETVAIRRNLRKVVDFLRIFADEASASIFSNVPQSFSKAVLGDVRSLCNIVKEIPEKCQLQRTSAVPPSYHGQERATADRVDEIHGRLLSNLSFYANYLPAAIQPQNDASPSGNGSEAKDELEVWISYAWGSISSEAPRQDRERQELVERMCQVLENDHWRVVRDKAVLKYGDIISTFMSTLAQGNLIIVVLSSKYLHSPNCISELYDIYRQCRGEKEEFLRRIIPLVLDDAEIGTWRQRAAHAKHWQEEFEAMEKSVGQLGDADLNLYNAMKRWKNEVADMLFYIGDKLAPRGFEEIVKDDFEGLRQMLSRLRSP